MKTLKKTLCVVLAVVMVVGTLALTAGATDYVDDAQITYDEAVEVLTGLGIFEGGDGNAFEPQRTITRAEMATVMYRITTGDVAGTQAVIYSKLDYFDDIDEDEWYAGYVNYCAHEGISVGDDFGNYNPDDKVTGHQVLIMLLRAIGYNEKDEFTGDDWNVEAAAMANEMKITSNIDVTKLSNASPREEVAEMVFRAISENDMVKWVPAIGYVSTNETIGEHEFDLEKETAVQDVWGRPSDKWKFTGGSVSIAYEPDAYYYEAVAECDVNEDTGVTDVITYTNGKDNAVKAKISATATRATIGAQGRETYVYTDVGAAKTDIIVYIDTFLARVAGVTEVKYDDNGHIAKQASLTLEVYDKDNGSTRYTETANTNYSYSVNDMLLVNATTVSAADHAAIDAKTVEIIDTPASVVGSQSYIQWNADQHTIEGDVYDDALHFHLDPAGQDDDINYCWWIDQFGNVIGNSPLARTSYAVLKDIIWTNERAEATIIYMNGEETTVVVNSIDGDGRNAATENFWSTNYDDSVPVKAASVAGFLGTTDANDVLRVSDESRFNEAFEGFALYQVYTNDDGTVDLNGFEDTLTGDDLIIDYANNARIDIHGSEIINGGVTEAYVDSSTQIVVNNGDGTYSFYTGTDALADFANGSVEVFWAVDDDFTPCVYIKSFVPQAGFGRHLFTTEKTVGHEVGNTDYYIMNVYVDGVEREIVTTKALMDILEENTGKLFHVTFDTVPMDAALDPNETYGYVSDVKLVNEGSDGDARNGCNYLSGSYTLGNNAIIDNVSKLSYNLSSTTQVISSTSVNYTVKTLAEAVAEDMGIWVVDTTRDGIVNNALTIYVGTKLSDDDSITITAKTNVTDSNIVLTGTDYNVKLTDRNTDGVVTRTGDDKYAMYQVDGGAMTLSSVSTDLIFDYEDDTSYTITVYPEDGTGAQTWTVSLNGYVMVDNAITSIKSSGESISVGGATDPLPMYSNFNAATTNAVTLDVDAIEYLAVFADNGLVVADVDASTVDQYPEYAAKAHTFTTTADLTVDTFAKNADNLYFTAGKSVSIGDVQGWGTETTYVIRMCVRDLDADNTPNSDEYVYFAFRVEK